MLKRYVALCLVIVMSLFAVIPRVEAAFSSSQAITLQQVDRESDLRQIQTTLETKIIEQRLQDLGFTGEEIKTRLNQLSDQQIHSLAQKIDDLRVGKDNVLGVIMALLVIAILVVVLLQLTGHKIIVTD